MINTIIWAIILLVTALGSFLLGRKSKNGVDYLRGRGEGWRACEDMVIERIKTNTAYNYEKVLKDLLQ